MCIFYACLLSMDGMITYATVVFMGKYVFGYFLVFFSICQQQWVAILGLGVVRGLFFAEPENRTEPFKEPWNPWKHQTEPEKEFCIFWKI